MMFSETIVSEQVETAATDGKRIFLNQNFVERLSSDELEGLLVHEVLHMALLHVTRKQARNPMRWNIACDIVINAMIVDAGLKLPKGAIFDDELCHLSAEDVYERLPQSKYSDVVLEIDLIGTSNAASETELRGYWQNASAQASIVQDRAIRSGRFQGTKDLGAFREWREMKAPELDWRTVLWNYMVRTPTDYCGYDRRFVGRGLYLDAVDGESVNIAVCIDTSASVSGDDLSAFFAELKSIVSSYPGIDCDVYFADSSLYEPCKLSEITNAQPKGGGGTSFAEFFQRLDERPDELGVSGGNFLAIYMTDGEAEFPEQPDFPVLWVLTAAGVDAETVPYGHVAKLRSLQ
jgi:predicted metal-dependent peptidase